ncbi:hypothetical protein [Nocardia sp. IFM 10818]
MTTTDDRNGTGPVCENVQLIWGGNRSLDGTVPCPQPGTERRERRGRTRYFCPAHAHDRDLFSARLKLVSLKVWDLFGDDRMRDFGHRRPAFTHEETRALHDAGEMTPPSVAPTV